MTTSKKVTPGLIFLLLVGQIYMDQFSDKDQHRDFTLANVGESVTLTCLYQEGVSCISWYKQMFGDIPRLVSSHMTSDDDTTFYNKFKNNPRFSVQRGKGINHLKISNLRLSDSATYYCGTSEIYIIDFRTRVALQVNGSGSDEQMIARRPVSESVRPGDSVTLNCEVHAETCDGETGIYWFRRSGESHVQIFYSHNSGNCERIFKAGSPTQSCTYSLPVKNLTFSDAGTYYCAVASCGEILFGNKTKLDIVGTDPVLLPLVCCLGAALAVFFILTIVLAYIVYKLNKKTWPQRRGQLRGSPLSPDAGGHDAADNLHYAALSLSDKNRSRRQRDNTETVCVYSGIRE